MTKSIVESTFERKWGQRKGENPFFKEWVGPSFTSVMYNMAKSIARNHFKLLVDKTWAWLNAVSSLEKRLVVVFCELGEYKIFSFGINGGDEDLFKRRSTVNFNILNLHWWFMGRH